MNIQKVNDVLSTTDYDGFKLLDGNRSIEECRVNKIINSINDVGWVTNPIIVNSKYEIIDGQGRFMALQQLSMPIEFIIVPNAGIDECIAMNIYLKNWSMKDFIDSYATRKYPDYIRLQQIFEMFPKFSLRVIWTAIFRVTKDNTRDIKAGNVHISVQQYNEAIARLKYLTIVYEDLLKEPLKIDNMILQSILLYYDFVEVDKDRLRKRAKYIAKRSTWTTNEECELAVEKAYNHLVSDIDKQSIAHLIKEERILKRAIDNEATRKRMSEHNPMRK